MRRITRQKFIAVCIGIVEEMRENFVPNLDTRYRTSTGNMALNALQYSVERDVFHIWIDDKIAPYVYYTEYPWTSPKWHGKQNPNEGWWERFYEEFARRLANKLKGELR